MVLEERVTGLIGKIVSLKKKESGKGDQKLENVGRLNPHLHKANPVKFLKLKFVPQH